MNNQEKALRVVEILSAWTHDKKTIYTYPDRDPIFCIGLRSPATIQLLLAHPERFSIKKEPEFLYVNVMQSSKENHHPYTESWRTWEVAKQAAKKLTESGCKVLVEAHPIALPE